MVTWCRCSDANEPLPRAKLVAAAMSGHNSDSFVMDKETYMKMVELMEKAEKERGLAAEEAAACKQQLKELQGARGQQVGKLERAKRQLSSENGELRNLCHCLDNARQKNKMAAIEWQNFGKYTATVLKNEVETFESKLHVLQEQLNKQVRENMELQEMCFYLDQSRGEEKERRSRNLKTTPTDSQNAVVSVHSLCAPVLNKTGGQVPQYMGVTSHYTLEDRHKKQYTWRNIQDPKTAVAELEKRVEQLETEKLELIKSLSAAHLLAAEAPTPSVSKHTRDTFIPSPADQPAAPQTDSDVDFPPDLYTFLKCSTTQQGTPPQKEQSNDNREQLVAAPLPDDDTTVEVTPHVVLHAVTLLEVCRRLDAMEANGFPDSMEEAEVAALRVMVDIAWKRLQDQMKSSPNKH